MALSLADRMQALPQEVFDQAYGHTFATDGSVRIIDKNWRPPAMLHVDCESREEYARSYFGDGAVFYIKGLNIEQIVRWVASLKRRHRKLISKLQLDAVPLLTRQGETAPNPFTLDLAGQEIEELLGKLFNKGGKITNLRGKGLLCRGVVAVEMLYPKRWEDEEFFFGFWTRLPGWQVYGVRWVPVPECEDAEKAV